MCLLGHVELMSLIRNQCFLFARTKRACCNGRSQASGLSCSFSSSALSVLEQGCRLIWAVMAFVSIFQDEC